jgi:hypothetical protein
MANVFDVGGFVSKSGKMVATLRLVDDSGSDVVVDADGTTSVFDLLKVLCQEVVDKVIPDDDPQNPTPEWNPLRRIPEADTKVTLILGLHSETK